MLPIDNYAQRIRSKKLIVADSRPNLPPKMSNNGGVMLCRLNCADMPRFLNIISGSADKQVSAHTCLSGNSELDD